MNVTRYTKRAVMVGGLLVDDGGVLQVGPFAAAEMVQAAELIEAGAGTYTAHMILPPKSIITDVGVHAIAVWNSTGAVSLIMGDAADPDGFFAATNLKATDLVAGETNNIEHPGGLAGAYIAAEQRKIYQDTERSVDVVVTVASGTGTQGHTIAYVKYGVVPKSVAVVKS